MDYVWYVASCAVGLAFGLYFGRLLTAIVANWEGTAGAVRWTTSVVGFVVGGGGGAIIFERIGSGFAAALYLLGLAVALIATFFWPKMPPRQVLDLEMVVHLIRMNEALRDEVPEIEERALLIVTPFERPKAIERRGAISEQDLARRLEQAADTLGGGFTDES